MPMIHYVHLGIRLAEAAAAGVMAAREGAALVQRLIDEGRDPTQAEWERLHAISADLHQRIQEA